ncbi:glycosyltransferase family 4 protein [Bordetella genomosp. 13]|uniref:glycosyltransferase family 4 protein n=1 Tax=Bordetella genomosp. 13 TaxID=463040 RepID=UPI0011A83C32|nr:glycosyltransferase family 4 protein [Bordetella genomosp. 13]
MTPDDRVRDGRGLAPRGAAARRLRVLIWHAHGNYLHALTQAPHDFYVPVHEDGRPGYGALGPGLPWGANVHAVPVEQVRDTAVDCVVYQSRQNLGDAWSLLTPAQRGLPCAYIEHNPPEPHPTDTVHPFGHPRGILVHVTPHNAQMWDRSGVPVRVIEHGVPVPPEVRYVGELPRGIVVVNHLARRGRRLGADLYADMRRELPLDLIGMQSQALGGLGEVPNRDVAAFMSRYRFYFSPIRYGSLSLSLVEAMLCGIPVIGYATTELPSVIDNGVNGYVDSRLDRVAEVGRMLIEQPDVARRWGDAARATAQERFSIERFVADWCALFDTLMGDRRA